MRRQKLLLAEFFAHLRRAIVAAEERDAEPDPRFSEPWFAWQRRHWERDRRRIELTEAEALSAYPEDPAPVASLGLAPFLAWCRREQERRRSRPRRVV